MGTNRIIPLILAHTREQTAKKFGYGSALRYLLKGLKHLGIPYTLNPKHKFNLIVAWDSFQCNQALILKEKTGYTLIYDVHLYSRIPAEKLLAENSDHVIVHSNLMKNLIQREHSINNSSVIPYGVDTQFWQPTHSSNRESFILYTGRTIYAIKNYLKLVEVCLKEKVRLITVGDRKYVSRNKLRELYSKAKLHILPSTFEPFGLVTLEAMSCGCSVAVSTKSGVADFLDEDHAVLFDPNNFSIKELIEKSQKLTPKEQRNYILKNYTHIHYAKRYIEKLESILKK